MGAAPIQNIGAYGVEVKDVITSCDVYHFTTGQIEAIPATACGFGYRDSIFKQQAGQYLVCYVSMRLSKYPRPILTYEPVVQALHERSIEDPTQSDIADIIEGIRWSKLPKPELLGNTGSFFKNPIVPSDTVQTLLDRYPTMPHFTVDKTSCKIPAAWLIEQAGLKGTRHDAIGTFPLQPLVIVNYGGGTGQQIADFAAFIIHHVKKKFGIVLHPEVQFWK